MSARERASEAIAPPVIPSASMWQYTPTRSADRNPSAIWWACASIGSRLAGVGHEGFPQVAVHRNDSVGRLTSIPHDSGGRAPRRAGAQESQCTSDSDQREQDDKEPDHKPRDSHPARPAVVPGRSEQQRNGEEEASDGGQDTRDENELRSRRPY